MTLRLVVHLTALATIALFAPGCRPSEREYETLDAWLLCDDCEDGEREAVREIGDKLVHTLDQALQSPTPQRIANKEAQFRQVYRTLSPPPLGLSESAYVAELRSNYIARYQQRAALSLGDIGGSRAITALRKARDSAVVRAYRPDVVAVIESVLALKESDTFAGTVNPRTPRFADTVQVGQGTGLAWNGDESVRLLGSPFADSVVIARSPNSLTFVAAALPGYTAVVIRGLGPNSSVSQVAPLQIVPPPYRANPPGSAPELTGYPFPQIRYLALPSAPKDSGDHFRFEPAVSRPITASVTGADVRGGTVSWLVCSTLGGLPVVAPAKLAGRVVDENGGPVVGADVRIVGLATNTTTGVGGRFVLSNLAASSPILVRVQMLGYQSSDNLVQLGVDSVTLLIRSPGSNALGTFASSVTVPAGGCRYLRITSAPPTRIIRLRLISP